MAIRRANRSSDAKRNAAGPDARRALQVGAQRFHALSIDNVVRGQTQEIGLRPIDGRRDPGAEDRRGAAHDA